MNTIYPAYPILLTSSIIAHDRGVKLQDEESRLYHVLNSVEKWLRINPSLSIVICDGSYYDMNNILNRRFPHSKIEYLRFKNDPVKVGLFGRGYGEGEIIRYAINHSELIKNAGGFSKCTAKLWVDNYWNCLHNWNEKFLCKGVFLDAFSPFKPTLFHHIDTRFYIVNTSFYRDYFIDAHYDINVESGHGLEECFRDIWLNKDIKHAMFLTYPVIQGVGGGTGMYYSNRALRIWKERLRLRFIQKDKKFSHFF